MRCIKFLKERVDLSAHGLGDNLQFRVNHSVRQKYSLELQFLIRKSSSLNRWMSSKKFQWVSQANRSTTCQLEATVDWLVKNTLHYYFERSEKIVG
jgi:hypothetical protein